jgi:hypothetical protein
VARRRRGQHSHAPAPPEARCGTPGARLLCDLCNGRRERSQLSRQVRLLRPLRVAESATGEESGHNTRESRQVRSTSTETPSGSRRLSRSLLHLPRIATATGSASASGCTICELYTNSLGGSPRIKQHNITQHRTTTGSRRYWRAGSSECLVVSEVYLDVGGPDGQRVCCRE